MRAFTTVAAFALAGAVAGSCVVSCTFLVRFDDVPCDGGSCVADGSPPAPDAARDSESDTAPSGDDGGPDAEAGGVADHYAPCSGLTSGAYCATDGLNGYAGSSSDLVDCVDGGIGTVVTCPGGCLKMPNPFPDACNPCPGHADGLYCGRDLAGFPPRDADFLIQCQLGNVVQSVACAHGCNSAANPRACYP